MLYNLIIGRYLCFHKHRRKNIKVYLNIYSRENIFFFCKGIQQSSFIIGMMIQKNLRGYNLINESERMDVMI